MHLRTNPRPESSHRAAPPRALAALALAALALFPAGCASAPPRFVLLESDAYACGAAPDLGCGLAIAPVLATLDDLEGVQESRVSWDGRTFQIELDSDADPERVAAAASDVLGGEVQVAAAGVTEAAAGPEHAAWLDSTQTVALSRREAEVLAASFVAELPPEVTSDPASREQLHAALREELERAFERAHEAGGGIAALWDQLPEARAAFESRLSFLTPDQRALLASFLDRALGAS